MCRIRSHFALNLSSEVKSLGIVIDGKVDLLLKATQPVRQMVVVQPYAKIAIHGDVVLLRAGSFRSSVRQENVERKRLHAQQAAEGRKSYINRIS